MLVIAKTTFVHVTTSGGTRNVERERRA